MVAIKRLIELRKKHNLTQQDAANLLGVARTTYSGWEHGHREIDFDSLLSLRSKYQVSLDYLFGLTDNPITPVDLTEEEVEFLTKTLEVFRSLKNKY